MRSFNAVALAVLLTITASAACGGPAPAGPLPVGKPAVWPLRGTPAPDADSIRRRPIVVRVANDRPDRPQAGLAEADVVFEILVEGGLTRFAVVYHSQDANSVGPIRSARLSDLHYTPMLRGILAHVGAQPEVMKRIREAAGRGAFVDLDQFQHADAYDRVAARPAPHNVYTSTKRIREAAERSGDRAKVDVPALTFESTTTSRSEAGKPHGPVALTYTGGRKVTYELAGSAYRRAEEGQATIDDATKRDVEIANVIVIKTDFTEAPDLVEDEHGSRSLEVRTTGTGPVLVLSAGQRFEGTWSRQGDEMYRFADAAGATIALKPGLTWIHVVRPDIEVAAD
jgi:hypothetical protein